MINALSKILGRKRSNSSDQNNVAPTAPAKTKETIWQKATSLRQSLRHSSSRSKVGQKTGTLPDLSYIDSTSDHRKVSSIGQLKNSILRREWGSQRNLARERRSLAAAPKHPSEQRETHISKRSLHARSFCASGDGPSWDLDALVKSVPEGIDRTSAYFEDGYQPSVELPKHQRSTRKLTKDSGYETSAQGDPDYINTLSDWLSEEKALNEGDRLNSRSKDKDQKCHNTPKEDSGRKVPMATEKRWEWNPRHRTLSFSHQEVPIERKNRQLRHSFSQREVSTSLYQENHLLQHHLRQQQQQQAEPARYSTENLKPENRYPSIESVSSINGVRHLAKSTPHLHHSSTAKRPHASSVGNVHPDDVEGLTTDNMVTRRFKKGSVYDALASTSGLDFAPVVQLRTYHSRREDQPSDTAIPKPANKTWGNSGKRPSLNSDKKSEIIESHATLRAAADVPKANSSIPSDTQSKKSSPKESKSIPQPLLETSKTNCGESGGGERPGCVTAHEKYPSWPVTNVPPTSSSTTFRSHSWTGHTDYPKEKVGYLRPKKSFKISTNQLQPVLEKSQDGSMAKKTTPDLPPSPSEEFRMTPGSPNGLNSSFSPSNTNISSNDSSVPDKPFDFEAFHTPCIPRCFNEKNYNIHSPPQRDMSSSSSKTNDETSSTDSNGFLSRYEEVLRQHAQYSAPLSMWSKDGSDGMKDGMDTPFLDKLRLDNASAWPHSTPPPPQFPLPAPSVLLDPANPPGNDIELSSENGTWMGSMESSSHGRGLPKWQGSYSDLSTLSTQLSNRSSLFDSGHSTMPESGRLSPQSSCGSTAPSLLLEGPTRAQVVARHGCHREIVAHSARVQQPERHGSESVLYYATGGLSRPKTAMSFNVEDRAIKSPEPIPGPSGVRQSLRNNSFLEEPTPYVHRSQASLTLSPSNCSKSSDPSSSSVGYSPKRESRNSNSFSSEDSNLRGKDGCGEDTSGSSSDVSNITCISNYRERASTSKSWDAANFHHQNIGQSSTHSNKGHRHGSFDACVRPYDHRSSGDKQHNPLLQTNVNTCNSQEARKDPFDRNVNESEAQHRRKQNQPSSRFKNDDQMAKSRSMDESSRKLLYPDADKRQRVSEPDLKTIQKQAVFSFYQRMSLAESVKSSAGYDGPSLKSPTDFDPPPPYEASSSNKLRMSMPKMSLLPNKYVPQSFDENAKADKVNEQQCFGNRASTRNEANPGLVNNHSKSVPNLVNLKAQSLDMVSSSYHPVPNSQHHPQKAYWSNGATSGHSKRGSPLAKEEIIPWDQLPSVLEKNREAAEKAHTLSESKDPPEDGSSSSSSATNYFKGHKSPRKVQLKEVHHANETASVKVITPDGVTLVQASSTTTSDHPSSKSKEDKFLSKDKHHHHHKNNSNGKVPHKRRPAPPPPPKQPPKRPPPPPPPESPEPTSDVVVILDKEEQHEDIDKELQELRIDERNGQEPSGLRCPPCYISSSSSSPQLLGSYGSSSEVECCSSPELPLPPPPPAGDCRRETSMDEPLPPPPETMDVELANRTLDSTSLVYPKNSYMSYRSEKKLGRQGFDGNYRRSFHASASSVDLTHLGNFHEVNNMLSPSSWEQMHNIRQHGTTVIFHSDNLHASCDANSPQMANSCQDFPMGDEVEKAYNISNPNQTESDCRPDVEVSECPVPCATSQENICMLARSLDLPNGDNLPLKTHQEMGINCNDVRESSPIQNGGFVNDTVADPSNKNLDMVCSDQNQNPVDNQCERNVSTNNNSDLIIRTNSSTQTTDTPRLKRRHTKTKQELECERLSMDFVHRFGDLALKNLLVPVSNHKTMTDYMEGLLCIELDKSPPAIEKVQNFEDSYQNQNGHWEENNRNAEVCDGQDFNTSLRNHCTEILVNQNLNEEAELRKIQEDLMSSIRRKIENLQGEQSAIREEMQKNEKLGKEITKKVHKVAKPNEIEKYTVHVEEMEKIMNLLLSLSGRLAKAVNLLESLPKDAALDEKRLLIAKRDKLMEQHEDARQLKESIDRRSNQVSTFLRRYLSDKEFAEYDCFIKMKTKLIVDMKDMDEKISLGEQQLAALKNSIDVYLWKSANS